MAGADPNADIQAQINALVPPSATTGAPAFKLDTPDKEAKARAALVEVGVRDRSPEMEYLIETGKVNAAPIAARIGRGIPEPPKPTSDPNLDQTRLVRDYGPTHPFVASVPKEQAGYAYKKLLDQQLAPEKAKPFEIDPSQLTPEEQASIKGLSPADASAVLKEQRGDAAKRQRAEQLVEQLKIRFPKFADQLDALKDTPEAIPNIMSSLYSREFAPEKPVKPEPFRIDRSHLPPGLAKYAPYMSDEQIGGLAAADYKTHQTQGGNPPGFKGLTIVQDARFKRSGLRTGDTVCIKIP